MKPANLPLAIFSLLLSVALWLYVFPQRQADEDERTLAVKLSGSGLPPDMVITRVPETVTLTAKGNATKLDDISQDPHLEAVVNLAAARAGAQRYTVTIYPAKYRDFFPGKQTALVECEKISSRTLSVEVETQGQMGDPTLVLDDTLVNPPTVKVSGPRSVIEKLRKARVLFDLRPVTISDKDPQSPAVEALFENGSVAENITLEPKIVTVTPIISSAPQQKQVNVLAETSGSPPQGYIMAGFEVSPATVAVRGTSRALAAITQLATDPVDVSQLTKTTDFVVNLRVPRGVSVYGPTRVRVRVMVNALPSSGSTGQ